VKTAFVFRNHLPQPAKPFALIKGCSNEEIKRWLLDAHLFQSWFNCGRLRNQILRQMISETSDAMKSSNDDSLLFRFDFLVRLFNSKERNVQDHDSDTVEEVNST